MSNKRETKEIILPSGKKTKIYSYQTGFEADEVQRMMLESIEMEKAGDANNPNFQMKSFNPGIDIDTKHKLLQQLVVSIDEVSKNVFEIVKNLPAKDYRFLLGEIDKVVVDAAEDKKKQQ